MCPRSRAVSVCVVCDPDNPFTMLQMAKKKRRNANAKQPTSPAETPAYSQPPPALPTEGWMLDAFSDDPLNEQQSGTS